MPVGSAGEREGSMGIAASLFAGPLLAEDVHASGELFLLLVRTSDGRLGEAQVTSKELERTLHTALPDTAPAADAEGHGNTGWQ